MSKFASADLTNGQTNALVKLVGGKEVVEMVLRGQLELSLLNKGSKESISRNFRKLDHKAIARVKALKGIPTKDFFSGECGIKVEMGDEFKKKILPRLPLVLSCPKHTLEVFTLTEDVWPTEILIETGRAKCRSVQEVVASMVSRITMRSIGSAGHELTDDGNNLESAFVHGGGLGGSRIIMSCDPDLDDKNIWNFDCSHFGDNGVWSDYDQFSIPALGA